MRFKKNKYTFHQQNNLFTLYWVAAPLSDNPSHPGVQTVAWPVRIRKKDDLSLNYLINFEKGMGCSAVPNITTPMPNDLICPKPDMIILFGV